MKYKLDRIYAEGRGPLSVDGIDLETGEITGDFPILNQKGQEVLDPTPVPQPIGETKVRVGHDGLVDIFETGDENDDDFEVPDEDVLPLTPFQRGQLLSNAEMEALGLEPKKKASEKKKGKKAATPADDIDLPSQEQENTVPGGDEPPADH